MSPSRRFHPDTRSATIPALEGVYCQNGFSLTVLVCDPNDLRSSVSLGPGGSVYTVLLPSRMLQRSITGEYAGLCVEGHVLLWMVWCIARSRRASFHHSNESSLRRDCRSKRSGGTAPDAKRPDQSVVDHVMRAARWDDDPPTHQLRNGEASASIRVCFDRSIEISIRHRAARGCA